MLRWSLSSGMVLFVVVVVADVVVDGDVRRCYSCGCSCPLLPWCKLLFVIVVAVVVGMRFADYCFQVSVVTATTAFTWQSSCQDPLFAIHHARFPYTLRIHQRNMYGMDAPAVICMFDVLYAVLFSVLFFAFLCCALCARVLCSSLAARNGGCVRLGKPRPMLRCALSLLAVCCAVFCQFRLFAYCSVFVLAVCVMHQRTANSGEPLDSNTCI